MSLQAVRKILLASLLLLFFIAGLWLVVANAAHVVTLNLWVVEIAPVSSGVLTLLSFIAGSLTGILVALFAFRVFPLHFQLRRSRRELDMLRRQNTRPPEAS